MNPGLIWAALAGVLMATVLGVCGIVFTTWQFWLIMLVTCAIMIVTRAVERVW